MADMLVKEILINFSMPVKLNQYFLYVRCRFLTQLAVMLE
jgi:hypothetical protein